MAAFRFALRRWMVFAIAMVALLWSAPEIGRYLTNTDHGWQLAMGHQVLLGRIPYVDLFYHYGPLVGFSSALGLWLTGSVVGEALICSLGYALALQILHRLSRRRFSVLAGWLLPLMGFWLLARFYKWYYWFFPLAVIYAYDRYLESLRTDNFRLGRRWLFMGGVLSAAGALFRQDLGVVFGIFFCFVLLAESLPSRRRWSRFLGRGGVFAAGFAVPLVIWLAVLEAAADGGGIRTYLFATVSGSTGYVSSWAKPMQPFEWSDPLSARSGLFLGQVLYVATCLLCTAIGGWRAFLLRRDPDGDAQFMAAVGLLGLGLSPQGFVRADLQHLLQILPLMLLGAWSLLHCGWLVARSGRNRRTARLCRVGVVIYALLLAISAAGIQRRARSDLTPLGRNPIAKYENLHQGVEVRGHRAPGDVARKVRELTHADDPILVVPMAPQLYVFADRPMSGLLVGYARGVFDSDDWRRRNLAEIRRHPPVAIVTRGEFSDRTMQQFRKSQPELYRYLQQRYTQRVYKAGYWRVFVQPGQDGSAPAEG